jgi:uncharacterized protein
MLIREMTSEECCALLARKGFGRLACSFEGQPYIVPVYFVIEAPNYLYGFATRGRKIEWMRTNPLVCVETDEVVDHLRWKSAIAFGRYEELPDLARWKRERWLAHTLLEKRPMWWQPAYVASTHRGEPHSLEPVFYRIRIDEINGHEASPDAHELAAMIEESAPVGEEESRPGNILRQAVGMLRHEKGVLN